MEIPYDVLSTLNGLRSYSNTVESFGYKEGFTNCKLIVGGHFYEGTTASDYATHKLQQPLETLAGGNDYLVFYITIRK